MLAFFLITHLVFLTSSSHAEGESSVQPKEATTVLTQKNSEAKSLDPSQVFLNSWFSSIEQAESVEREVLKLIFNDVSLPAKSLLGKLKVVLAKALKKKNIQVVFSCQKFTLQNRSVNAFSAYETCIPKDRPEIFYFESVRGQSSNSLSNPLSNQLQVTFYLPNLHDVVGFGSAILRRTAKCTLTKKGDELIKMTCQDIASSRKPEEVIILDELTYEKDGASSVKVHGKFYRELLPSKSIAIDVPKEGKVRVEIRLIERVKIKQNQLPVPPPRPPIQPAVPAPAAPPAEKELDNGEGSSKKKEGVFANPPDATVSPELQMNTRGRYQVNPPAPQDGVSDPTAPKD